MRIVFVRHGEPDYRNDCLTETGRKQAALCAERLREEGISEIYSSPLGRAAETAAYASESLGLPVHTLDFMRELHWGSRDGETVFANGHPWDIADELGRQGVNLNDPGWRAHPFFSWSGVLTGGLPGSDTGGKAFTTGVYARMTDSRPWRCSATGVPPAQRWGIC